MVKPVDTGLANAANRVAGNTHRPSEVTAKLAEKFTGLMAQHADRKAEKETAAADRASAHEAKKAEQQAKRDAKKADAGSA